MSVVELIPISFIRFGITLCKLENQNDTYTVHFVMLYEMKQKIPQQIRSFRYNESIHLK